MTSVEEADAAFARGDYRLAKQLYSALPADAHVQARLRALTIDKLALSLGVGTLLLVVLTYLLARFAG